jgi:predicted Zn-dependent protease
MPIMTKAEVQVLLKKVLALSKADECEVNLNGNDSGNIRYALSSVSTSGGISKKTLVVSSAFGKKVGEATVSELDEASLERAVRRSEELAHLAPENPDHMPLLGPQQYQEAKTFIPATAAITPMQRADAVAESLKIADAANLNAAGFYDNTTGFAAMMNSKGLFAYNTFTNVAFNVTLRTQDGKGSGYAARGFNDVAKLDVAAATRVAAQKATASGTAKAIEPGKYTVILEPEAAVTLVQNMMRGFDARSADEGRSFMSKPGGGTRLGEKLVDEQVTIFSDPLYPDLPTSTWANDGRPLEKVTWIEKGVIKNLSYSRFWADKKGVKATPAGDGMIMMGGDATLEELIKGTERGVLVTRLWYIRAVDPQTQLYTGLTRDGTFYIENGKIKFPIKNFRFNESPIIMLNNLEALGKPERTDSRAMIPPMRIRDFTFTSLSDAV